MLEVEVLVIKLVAVHRDAACAIPFDKVSTLTHEALDDSVERATLVADGLTSFPAAHEARSTRASVGAGRLGVRCGRKLGARASDAHRNSPVHICLRTRRTPRHAQYVLRTQESTCADTPIRVVRT